MRVLLRDVRYGLRTLRKSRGFAIVAIFTIALGIGANTAIFSLLDGLAFRILPVVHPHQLVRFGAHRAGDPYVALSLPMFREIAHDQRVFSEVFVWWGGGISNVQVGGDLLRAEIQAVGGNFYSDLGAVPAAGRLIEPEDVNLEAGVSSRVAVLGYGFWQHHYGGSKDVIGKTLKIENLPFTIIGVTREGFNGMSADNQVEVTVPLTAEPLIVGDSDVQKHLQRRDVLWLFGAGRLNPGVTLNQARAQLESLWPAIRESVMPASQTASSRSDFLSMRMKVESGATAISFLREQFVKPIYILFGISGLILLIACVNLASLTLSRAIARNHEFGVRVALGASRWRLASQVLTESVTLSAAGTLAGLGLAYWGSHALAHFILSETYVVSPPALNMTPDLRILGFTATAAIVTGVLFGLPSAWSATSGDPNHALQQASRTVGQGIDKLGEGLVITQVALVLILLAGAGLFIRSLVNLRKVHPGFQIHGLLDAELYPKPGGYKNFDSVNYYRELTSRISDLPGVTSASIGHFGLGEGFEQTEEIQVQGRSAGERQADFAAVMPGFFRTVGIKLLAGRSFTWRDDSHSPRVAIISEDLAREAFPESNIIDQHLEVTTEPQWRSVQIVGIVSNASLYDIRKRWPLTLYVPATQYKDYMGYSELLVRTNVEPTAMSKDIQQTVESLGHEYVPWFWTVGEDIDRSLWRERVTALLSTFFGGLALLLVGIGLFGLMSYNVTRRTREIGIRVALGAQRNSIFGMVLRETLRLVFIGVVIGVPCAVGATRLIAHMLFGLSSYDPLTLTAVVLALVIVGTLAGYLPARRAMRVDPMVALRYE